MENNLFCWNKKTARLLRLQFVEASLSGRIFFDKTKTKS